MQHDLAVKGDLFEPVMNIAISAGSGVKPSILPPGRQSGAGPDEQGRPRDDPRGDASAFARRLSINVKTQIINFISGRPFEQYSIGRLRSGKRNKLNRCDGVNYDGKVIDAQRLRIRRCRPGGDGVVPGQVKVAAVWYCDLENLVCE